MKRNLFAAAVVLLATAGLCNADVITFGASFPTEDIGGPFPGIDGAPPLPIHKEFSTDVPLFDPALGTLTSITILYDLHLSVLLENPTGAAGSGSGTLGGPINFQEFPVMGLGWGNGGPVFAGSSATVDLPLFGVIVFDEEALGMLELFTGTGTQAMTFVGDGILFTSPDVVGTMTVLDTSTMSVSYGFTPVPEASTLAALAPVGMAGLVRRRR